MSGCTHIAGCRVSVVKEGICAGWRSSAWRWWNCRSWWWRHGGRDGEFLLRVEFVSRSPGCDFIGARLSPRLQLARGEDGVEHNAAEVDAGGQNEGRLPAVPTLYIVSGHYIPTREGRCSGC